MLGRIAGRLELSAMTVSGIDDVPAKFVQPVAVSHLKDLTSELVVLVQDQARRISPLCVRTAEG